MLQQKTLNEITLKEEITLFLLINKIEIKTAKTGNDFISLELKDQSGTIQAKIWEKIEEYSKILFDGAVVKVNGIVEEFNNTLQLNIKKIRLATPQDKITAEDFLPKSSRNFDEMKNEFFDVINSIKNHFIKKLLANIFNGDILNNYFRTPAGKNWHHSYYHGLLEHTLEIVKICDLVSSFHKEIKRDVLIAGALLHDIGKIEELTYSSNFDYTDKGKLIGHIMIGATLVEKHISLIPDFPENLKVEIIHLILSHQGKLEFASPIVPKTLEAIVLYQADELSAKTNAYKYAIEEEKNKNTNWTKYLHLAGTALYISKENN